MQQDLEMLDIEEGLARDQAKWRRIIASPTTRIEDDGIQTEMKKRTRVSGHRCI